MKQSTDGGNNAKFLYWIAKNQLKFNIAPFVSTCSNFTNATLTFRSAEFQPNQM